MSFFIDCGTLGAEWEFWCDLPAENTKNEVEHEEWTEDDERHEVDPVPGGPESVVGLWKVRKI